MRTVLLCIGLFLTGFVKADLVNTIKKVTPSIVGVGIYTPMGSPKNQLNGSGFVIGAGNLIVTNYHVVDQQLDSELLQKHVIFTGKGRETKTYQVELIAYAEQYDLAVLKLVKSLALPALPLKKGSFIDIGSDVAFTGFPLGSVLGLYPVTHRGIVSAITPTTTPVSDSRQITIQMLKRMRSPYLVYQLDATAYPGNSGSALYDQSSGDVVGIVNKVFVQSTKEAVISQPSGITYAIPVKYLHELLQKHQLSY